MDVNQKTISISKESLACKYAGQLLVAASSQNESEEMKFLLPLVVSSEDLVDPVDDCGENAFSNMVFYQNAEMLGLLFDRLRELVPDDDKRALIIKNIETAEEDPLLKSALPSRFCTDATASASAEVIRVLVTHGVEVDEHAFVIAMSHLDVGTAKLLKELSDQYGTAPRLTNWPISSIFRTSRGNDKETQEKAIALISLAIDMGYNPDDYTGYHHPIVRAAQLDWHMVGSFLLKNSKPDAKALAAALQYTVADGNSAFANELIGKGASVTSPNRSLIRHAAVKLGLADHDTRLRSDVPEFDDLLGAAARDQRIREVLDARMLRVARRTLRAKAAAERASAPRKSRN